MGNKGFKASLERFRTRLYDCCMCCDHLTLDGWMAERRNGPAYCEEDKAPWHEMRSDEHECRCYYEEKKQGR